MPRVPTMLKSDRLVFEKCFLAETIVVAYSLFLLPLLFMLLHMFLFCNVVLSVLNSYENTVLMKRERWLL